MGKFKDKYRIATARAHWWDYGWNGAYFITICTSNRKPFFGNIENGKMQLSQVGLIANILWHQIPRFSSFVELGEFVVMPNHIHGILVFDKPVINHGLNEGDSVERLSGEDVACKDVACNVSTINKNDQMAKISPKADSISSIIRSYKSAVTMHANRLGLKHSWQARFHDHIIRNDREFLNISDYIRSNPENWKEDDFYINFSPQNQSN